MTGSVYIDFETYCNISVKAVGAWRYSEDESCQVLCLAYSMEMGQEPELWVPDFSSPDPYHSPPIELLHAIEAGATVHAHNAMFEKAIWTNVLGWIQPQEWSCTMALVAYFSYPLSLEKAAEALGLEAQKDKEGKRLLDKFSSPSTRGSTKGTRILPYEDWEDFQKLCEYCRQDVRVEMAIIQALPRKELPDREKRIYRLDQVMNGRGIRVDVPTCRHVYAISREYAGALDEECVSLVGFRSGQRARAVGYADALGLGHVLPDYTAPTVEAALKRTDIPKNMRRLLEIRQEIGLSSVSKYSKILDCAGAGDRIRGMIQYYGANRTGRFAGRLVQPHNFPRGTVKDAHEMSGFLLSMGAEDVGLIADRPMALFSSCLRSMLVASEGKVLAVVDFASIEARILAWMAGQKDLVRQFFDGEDAYRHMAATIFNVPYGEISGDQRTVGKVAVLGCGYGLGAIGFMGHISGYGMEVNEPLAVKTVKAYRRKNSRIVGSWYALEDAVRSAIKWPGRTFSAFMCKVRVQTFQGRRYMAVRLPSERTLVYVDPRISIHDEVTYKGVDQKTSVWSEVATYGGKLVENVVQAVARDILADAMLRVEAHPSYDMLLTVHDELISEADPEDADLQEFTDLVRETPDWAQGCPIDAEGWIGERYRK